MVLNLVNVEEFANGSRVTLRFGNVTSAVIEGLSATLEWGKVDGTGAVQTDTIHTRTLTLKDELASGSWTESAINLGAIAPKELGFVRVKEISHSGLKLRMTGAKR